MNKISFKAFVEFVTEVAEGTYCSQAIQDLQQALDVMYYHHDLSTCYVILGDYLPNTKTWRFNAPSWYIKYGKVTYDPVTNVFTSEIATAHDKSGVDDFSNERHTATL